MAGMTTYVLVVAVSGSIVAFCAVGVAWYGHVINREIRKQARQAGQALARAHPDRPEYDEWRP
jgi:hypothetical protein